MTPARQVLQWPPPEKALLTFLWVQVSDQLGARRSLSRVSGLRQSETIKTGTACGEVLVARVRPWHKPDHTPAGGQLSSVRM